MENFHDFFLRRQLVVFPVKQQRIHRAFTTVLWSANCEEKMNTTKKIRIRYEKRLFNRPFFWVTGVFTILKNNSTERHWWKSKYKIVDTLRNDQYLSRVAGDIKENKHTFTKQKNTFTVTIKAKLRHLFYLWLKWHQKTLVYTDGKFRLASREAVDIRMFPFNIILSNTHPRFFQANPLLPSPRYQKTSQNEKNSPSLS